MYLIWAIQEMFPVSDFLDVSKAYDSTEQTGLLYKLIQTRVPGELIKAIDSYLAHRSFRVKMNRAVSEWKPMLAELSQGSPISPMLHNLCISDISKSIQRVDYLCG